MVSLLLAVIYLAFISLGLPDSLLGSGWPVMQIELGAPLSAAGGVAMLIAGSTILSSLFSDAVTSKLGPRNVIAFSILLTALSMLAFSFCTSLWQLCLLAIPYGLGAGAIDACLNNFVALHFSSRHMSWLHCFWAVGATISPYIMGWALTSPWGWVGGYRVVSFIQFGLTAIMFLSFPLWKKVEKKDDSDKNEERVRLPLRKVFTLRGALPLFIAFFCYMSLEATPILWASSYFSDVYGLEASIAADFGSLFYIGIMSGRALSGFIAEKVGDKNLIRIGASVAILSNVLVALPVGTYYVAVVAFVLMGLGCAPIYPSIIHSTPTNFGKKYSQSVIGVQMAFAYLGSTFMAPLFGLIAQHTTIKLLPAYAGFFAVILLVLTELVNRMVKQNKNSI